MISLAQNSSNDITVTNGNFDLVSGREAYANIITDAVRTLLGEIQLDTTLGTDYLGTVFDSATKQGMWRSDVEDTILRFGFVLGILSFDTSYDNATKVLNYKIVIQTDDGEITVES